MNERIDRIAQRNQEAERLLNILNASIDKCAPVPFDPGYLFDLCVYNDEGDTVARFPMEHTTYTIHENTLLIECYGALHTYPLNRFSYYTEGR